MNTTQVPTRSVNGLVATASSVAPLSSLHQGNKENASPLPPPVYRVITKESLQDNFEADPIISSPLTSSSNDDDHFFHSSLCDFDFSILEPDNKESEFLSLPLTSIELPLTPPPIEPIVSGSFDSAALLTPPAAVSVSTESSSSYLLSTAAAIAASQQHAVASSIRAPPIVSVAAPPFAVVSPKPTRKARAYSKSRCNSAKVTKQPQQPPGAAASTSLFNSLITKRLTERLMSSNINGMDHQPPQQAAVVTPTTIAAPPPALAPRPCPVPPAAYPRAGGQPLPPKKYAPASNPGGTMSQGVSAYHHTQPPPPAHHARARAVSNVAPPASPGTAPPNTVSAIHPTTGQVENTGRWTAEEHRLFLQGLEQHGKGWKKIATLIQSRTVVQIRTHAQKYFQKLAKARQNGETVVGPGMGAVGTGVMASVPPGHTVQFDAAEAREIGIAIPVGPDGQPVVTMRTTTHPNSSGNHHGNMSLGNDPASVAAAGGQVGIATAAGMAMSAAGGAMGGGRKRRNAAPGGGTKRRAIGNVVRSAVREGRNVKRQKIAEGKRKVVLPRGVTPAAHAVPSAHAVPVQVLSVAQPPANGAKEEYQVPNPLPAVSNVLDPYVATTTMGMRPPPLVAGTAAAAAAKTNGRGRQQMVQTATHGTLPMAALEDAVFRLLTPATGAPSPLMQPQPYPNCASSNAIIDPLAPSNPSTRIPIAHMQYYPTAPAPGTAYHQGITTGMSPTGVADMSLLPSWVDSKNPPSWYNDGSDIDTLLEDADCLNWLSDTGDLEETYAPAMVEPASVVSSSNSSGANTAASFILEPMPITVQDPTGSSEDLSFLVDPSEQQGMMLMAPMNVAAVLPQPGAAVTAHQDYMEEANRLPSFLDEDDRTPPPPPTITDQLAPEPTATTAETLSYSSATEAVEHKLAGVGESDTNLMGFPDLDMGDEQAFVSALLENSGQGTMSFPKLHSDLHMSEINMSSGNNQSGVALNCRVGSGVLAGEEHVLDQN